MFYIDLDIAVIWGYIIGATGVFIRGEAQSHLYGMCQMWPY